MTMQYGTRGGYPVSDTYDPGGGNSGRQFMITSASPQVDVDRVRSQAMYDVGNPARALRNVLREMGFSLNPFHGFGEQVVNQWALPAFSQYVTMLAQGGRPGAFGGVPLDFKDFLGQYMSGALGQGGITPWTSAQAAQGVSTLASLLQRVGDAASAPAAGMTQEQWDALPFEEKLQKLAGTGQLDQNAAMVASLIGSSPEMMQGFYTGAFAPQLGPTFSRALNNILSLQRQAWEDYLQPMTWGRGRVPTFLDMVVRSLLPG